MVHCQRGKERKKCSTPIKGTGDVSWTANAVNREIKVNAQCLMFCMAHNIDKIQNAASKTDTGHKP